MTKVIGVIDLGIFWIERVGELFKPLRRMLDLFICVSHGSYPRQSNAIVPRCSCEAG